MGLWRFAIGNAVRRAASAPVASLASLEDSLFPLSALGNGETDEPARWQRNSSGLYAADIDLNQLASSSPRQDAPTGWFDFLNLANGTPGLPADPPDWGAYGGRNPALRFFGPSAQDIDVMPGEALHVRAGLYLPSASSATAVRLRVIDLWTGRSYDGALNQWDDGDVFIAEQTATDAWLDFNEAIPADADRVERTRYRVLLEQDAASYDATSYCYASAEGASGNPAIFPPLSCAAIVGHNIPRDATVTVQDVGGGGSPITLTPEVPSFYGEGLTPQTFQSWRLTVQMPAGLLSFHERPYIGDLWLGGCVDMAWCPAFPFEVRVADEGQVRVPGGYGREYVFSDSPRETHALKLLFKVNGDAGYWQVRRFLEQATRQGADPMLLLPVDVLEGDVLYHGKLGNEVSYSRKNNVRREFTLAFNETPFPRVNG